MSRITPPQTGEFLSGLEDDMPYKASIFRIDWQTSEYKGKMQTQMVLEWLPEDADESMTIRDYVGMKLGTRQNGQVSKLKQILNAVGLQPKAKEIAWFDDETLEWSYDGEKPYAKLEVGAEAIIRGETVEKKSDVPGVPPKRRFVITGYRPSGVAEQPPPPVNSVRGRPALVKDDDVPDIPF